MCEADATSLVICNQTEGVLTLPSSTLPSTSEDISNGAAAMVTDQGKFYCEKSWKMIIYCIVTMATVMIKCSLDVLSNGYST